MSTLTKILIVLLTISSIFLCGIVVTYIGTATNYKDKFDERKARNQTLQDENDDLKAQITQISESTNQDTVKLNSLLDTYKNENAQLTTENSKLKLDLKDAQAKENNIQDMLAANTKTTEINSELRRSLDDKIAELQSLKIKSDSEIKDLTDRILAQNALLEQNEIERKQLVEKNTQLQNRLDQNLLQYGKSSTDPTAATTYLGSVPQATNPPIKNLGLEGIITEVQPKNSLASINIGSANGVKDNMRFHVLRGNRFICDIIILQTDADQASGYLDLVGDVLPKAGDTVKTNF